MVSGCSIGKNSSGYYEKRILLHVLSLNSWLLCSDIQVPTQDKRREMQSEDWQTRDAVTRSVDCCLPPARCLAQMCSEGFNGGIWKQEAWDTCIKIGPCYPESPLSNFPALSLWSPIKHPVAAKNHPVRMRMLELSTLVFFPQNIHYLPVDRPWER